MAAGHLLGATRTTHGFDHGLDVCWRLFGDLVHQEGHHKVHHRADGAEGTVKNLMMT